MSSAVCFPYEQLSLFDAVSGTAAVNLFDGRKYGVTEPTDLMKRLVPRATYAVVVGDHPQALDVSTQKHCRQARGWFDNSAMLDRWRCDHNGM